MSSPSTRLFCSCPAGIEHMSDDDDLRRKFIQLGIEYNKLKSKHAALKRERGEDRKKADTLDEKLQQKDEEIKKQLAEIDNLTFNTNRLRIRCDNLVEHIKQLQTRSEGSQGGWVGNFLGGGLSTKEEQLMREISVTKEELSKQILENHRVHLILSDYKMETRSTINTLTSRLEDLKSLLTRYEEGLADAQKEVENEKKQKDELVSSLSQRLSKQEIGLAECRRALEVQIQSVSVVMDEALGRIATLKATLSAKLWLDTDRYPRYQAFAPPALTLSRAHAKASALRSLGSFAAAVVQETGSLSEAVARKMCLSADAMTALHGVSATTAPGSHSALTRLLSSLNSLACVDAPPHAAFPADGWMGAQPLTLALDAAHARVTSTATELGSLTERLAGDVLALRTDVNYPIQYPPLVARVLAHVTARTGPLPTITPAFVRDCLRSKPPRAYTAAPPDALALPLACFSLLEALHAHAAAVDAAIVSAAAAYRPPAAVGSAHALSARLSTFTVHLAQLADASRTVLQALAVAACGCVSFCVQRVCCAPPAKRFAAHAEVASPATHAWTPAPLAAWALDAIAAHLAQSPAGPANAHARIPMSVAADSMEHAPAPVPEPSALLAPSLDFTATLSAHAQAHATVLPTTSLQTSPTPSQDSGSTHNHAPPAPTYAHAPPVPATHAAADVSPLRAALSSLASAYALLAARWVSLAASERSLMLAPATLAQPNANVVRSVQRMAHALGALGNDALDTLASAASHPIAANTDATLEELLQLPVPAAERAGAGAVPVSRAAPYRSESSHVDLQQAVQRVCARELLADVADAEATTVRPAVEVDVTAFLAPLLPLDTAPRDVERVWTAQHTALTRYSSALRETDARAPTQWTGCGEQQELSCPALGLRMGSGVDLRTAAEMQRAHAAALAENARLRELVTLMDARLAQAARKSAKAHERHQRARAEHRARVAVLEAQVSRLSAREEGLIRELRDAEAVSSWRRDHQEREVAVSPAPLPIGSVVLSPAAAGEATQLLRTVHDAVQGMRQQYADLHTKAVAVAAAAADALVPQKESAAPSVQSLNVAACVAPLSAPLEAVGSLTSALSDAQSRLEAMRHTSAQALTQAAQSLPGVVVPVLNAFAALQGEYRQLAEESRRRAEREDALRAAAQEALAALAAVTVVTPAALSVTPSLSVAPPSAGAYKRAATKASPDVHAGVLGIVDASDGEDTPDSDDDGHALHISVHPRTITDELAVERALSLPPHVPTANAASPHAPPLSAATLATLVTAREALASVTTLPVITAHMHNPKLDTQLAVKPFVQKLTDAVTAARARVDASLAEAERVLASAFTATEDMRVGAGERARAAQEVVCTLTAHVEALQAAVTPAPARATSLPDGLSHTLSALADACRTVPHPNALLTPTDTLQAALGVPRVGVLSHVQATVVSAPPLAPPSAVAAEVSMPVLSGTVADTKSQFTLTFMRRSPPSTAASTRSSPTEPPTSSTRSSAAPLNSAAALRALQSSLVSSGAREQQRALATVCAELRATEERMSRMGLMLSTVSRIHVGQTLGAADHSAQLRQVEHSYQMQLHALQGSVAGYEGMIEELTLKLVDLNEQLAERENQNIQVQQMLLNSGISPDLFAGEV